MHIRRDLARLAVVLALGFLAACGGGGGGGDGGGVAGGGSEAPLSYVGNSNPAVVTTSNAGAISASALNGGEASSSGAISSVSAPAVATDAGMVDVGRRLHRTARAALAQAAPLASGARSPGTSAIVVDDHSPCPGGGEIHLFGTVSDSGLGTLSLRYNACRFGDTTVSGAATMRVDAYVFGFGPTDYTISYARLRITSSAAVDVSGSLRTRLDIPARTETITENTVARYASGAMGKVENLVFVDVYNDLFNPTSYTETVSGRVFHSVRGWVDISTPVPLRFSTMWQEFPDNGMLLLTTGPGGARIQVTALSPTLVNLALDLDGNGTFERTAMLDWADLPGPVGANLADADGDGMHDGWEIAHTLNPNDPADALTDVDGDGASNRSEYEGGSNPRSAASLPPGVGLSIQAISDTPDPAFVGGNVTYTFSVSNLGGLPANNVVVTLPLVGATPVASLAQGSCVLASTIVCTLGTVNAWSSVSIVIVVAPTATGTLTSTATLSTSSFDVSTHDNSATAVTLVGLPGAGIQGRIDIASPGDTIIVEPGTYAGPINFRHKNVILRSRDGPATTIINGNGGTGEPVVSIGNGGGALIGFTITGGMSSFGAGVYLGASSSVLVAGNIFEGNLQSAGGYGAAIGGNAVASATIEGNLFRNNSCDNQFLAGVVSFINASSPRIVNNVFRNNPCRGLNLEAVNGPHQVINNTFVGNRAGIRLGRFVDLTKIHRNNILYQNTLGVDIENGASIPMPVLWTNNLVFDNTTNYPATVGNQTGDGNISVDPMLVSPATGNYDLQPGSPAIGAGTTLNAPATDFDGVARGASIDIGAFEGP